MSRYNSTLGIVINKKKIRESDLLITLLTPELGKITALAKGVQNIKSNRLGSLQLGNTVKVQLYTKNENTWISEAQTVSQFLLKEKKLTQVNLLFYFLEILNYFIAENQQIDEVFQISQKIIDSINNNQFKKYILNEINFIKILGFGLPPEIEKYYLKEDYKTTQNLIKSYLESIIEKPLESNKLFQ